MSDKDQIAMRKWAIRIMAGQCVSELRDKMTRCILLTLSLSTCTKRAYQLARPYSSKISIQSKNWSMSPRKEMTSVMLMKIS